MSKAKGSRAERKAIKLLEAAGFVCTKAGGSLGVFDVIALGPNAVRCVQVKAGTARLSRSERAAIAAVRIPAFCSREYWRFPDYCREPVIEQL
jgi:Holliday junction resolvase-like predicted endonuclease